MASRNNIFTTIHTEGALLPADLLQRISEGDTLDGLTPESYHRPGEKLNEAINRSWNTLQGAWASFRAAQERLPENDLGTSITRERWLLPLFRELDYGRLQIATAVEIDGRSYPISHSWEHVPVHLVSYQLELDRRTPGAAGAASASPHSLLQVFLNRSENNLWGFLSNGYKLRILRDNLSLTRQAYVEFDLEAMMDGEVYSDFVLLWLLCHQSRVEGERPSDCWLEKWMKAAEDQGTRALDQLRGGVEAAITALGLGFLEYPANHALRDKLAGGELSAQDYYRQLLRMVYRLLFLFVAEDRDLLLNPSAPQDARERYTNYYSMQRLRRMAETFKGTRHPDLFEGLRLVMALLSGDDSPRPEGEGQRVRAGEGLGLVPLGSFLFSDRAVTDIIGCQIANSHLLDAIRALSLTYDQRAGVYRTVDYKNLGSDELGSIFESLLELHPQINVPARRFALSTAAGNERKTTGSYYTPESLVNALLDSALNPVLEEAMKGSKAPALNPSPSGRGEKVREMASKAMREIARELRQRQTPAETVLWEALRKNRLGGLGFRRQHPVASTSYVVDFFCYSANLIVELDGEIHQFQQTEDAQRQADLEQRGYRIIRFPNRRVIHDLENVLIEILNVAHEKVPPPEGEGFRVGATTPEQRILSLKVCDPACGSGHFLIAAANRMAKALAFVRTGEEEPPPAAIQEAKRDIISHCIYGVDINPMAVELCKVNLWMEALEPGKPLNFLDHRIQVGNSLLGTTPKLMAAGIPDDAFNPIEGDDKQYATTMRKLNREERKARETGQRSMFELIEPPADYRHLTEAMHALDDAPDNTLDEVRRKEARYTALANDPEYVKARLLADAWCAAFVWEKKPPSPTLPPQGEGLQSGDSSPLAMRERGFRGEGLPMTDLLYRRMEKDPLAENLRTVREYVVELKERYQFFHWHIAFPDVFTVPENLPPHEGEGFRVEAASPPHEGKEFRVGAASPPHEGKEFRVGAASPPHEGEGSGVGASITGWNGGFDCVLGNPPWERIKIQEKEWFAERAPEIANAPNAASRRRAIAALEEHDPYLLQAFADDKRKAEGESHFVRMSQRYPLTGSGDINTYAIFTETARTITSVYGYAGLVIPQGIATDDNLKNFFDDLIQTNSLALLIGFENEDFIFTGIANVVRFCIFVMSGKHIQSDNPTFAFYIRQLAQIDERERFFQISAQDIALVNPNTLTSPIFRNRADLKLTKVIYERVPVLDHEKSGQNFWGAYFLRMFDMASDSALFLEVNSSSSTPLYEAKFFWHFDHRFGGYDLVGKAKGKGGRGLPNQLEENYLDPHYRIEPRYWVDENEFKARVPNSWNYKWFIGFRDVTSAKLERTAVFSLIPFVAVGHTAPLVFFTPSISPIQIACFLGNMNSLILDYNARQKLGGTHLTYGYLKQFPVLAPDFYSDQDTEFIATRVLELTYTAWDVQAFAKDMGYHGEPYVWDEGRREILRAELDAYYAKLYGLTRDELRYILDPADIYGESFPGETFRVLKEKEIGLYGEYRTQRLVLEAWDQMFEG